MKMEIIEIQRKFNVDYAAALKIYNWNTRADSKVEVKPMPNDIAKIVDDNIMDLIDGEIVNPKCELTVSSVLSILNSYECHTGDLPYIIKGEQFEDIAKDIVSKLSKSRHNCIEWAKEGEDCAVCAKYHEPKEDWEDGFDKEFADDLGNFGWAQDTNIEDVKSFIRSLVKKKSELDEEEVFQLMHMESKKLYDMFQGKATHYMHSAEYAKAICSKFSKPKADREGLIKVIKGLDYFSDSYPEESGRLADAIITFLEKDNE